MAPIWNLYDISLMMNGSTTKSLIKQLDDLVRQKVKARDDYKCQACGSFGVEHDLCHYIGRSNKAVRWDLDNLLVMCRTCHIEMDHAHATKFKDFFIRRLGDDLYYALKSRERTHFKTSEVNLKAALEALRNGAENYV